MKIYIFNALEIKTFYFFVKNNFLIENSKKLAKPFSLFILEGMVRATFMYQIELVEYYLYFFFC